MSGGNGGPVNPTRCKEKPWDLWVSEIGSDEPRPDEAKGAPSRRRTGISLLRHASMSLHGEFPQTDNLNAVVCHMCGTTVKCSGAYRHLAVYHSAAAEPALPPPPAPTVKLKSSHSRSKHKKEPPLPPPPEIEVPAEPAPRASLPTTVYYTEDEPKSITVPLPATAVGGEVQVCVDGDLPVVSIQDPEELPLGENITDDIFAIMNSEGIQSAEDPDSTAAWKNIIRDISTLQEISFQQPDGTEYAGDVTLPAYTIPDDLSGIQYASAPPPPQIPLPTVLDAIALNPAPPAPTRSRSKPSKSKYNFREYDPNKHCGVIAAETHKPCTRSLTCKAHTLSLRRTVEGRSKPFDTLLAEHKAAREASVAAAAAPPVLPPPAPIPLTLSIPPALLVNTSIDLSSFNSLASDQQVTDIYTSLLGTEDHTVLPDTSSITSLLSQALPPDQYLLSEDPELAGEVPILSIASPVEIAPLPVAPPPVVKKEEGPPAPVPSDVFWYSNAPRALALCTFNASNMGGAVVLGRKCSMVRGNIKSSLSRTQGKVAAGANSYLNFSQNSIASLSKTVHLNNATKCNKPEVRRLITCRSECTESEYARHNGHASTSKRSADVLEDCDSKRPHPSMLRNSVKVAKRATHSSDMLELSFMLDPLVADEKC